MIYSYRINNSLFRTQYSKRFDYVEKDHYRPKCRNSKEWDGWSGKSIFVDHLVRKKDLKIVLRLNFPKSLDTKLHEIVLWKYFIELSDYNLCFLLHFIIVSPIWNCKNYTSQSLLFTQKPLVAKLKTQRFLHIPGTSLTYSSLNHSLMTISISITSSMFLQSTIGSETSITTAMK